MKNRIKQFMLMAALGCVMALPASASYVTSSGAGNGTTPASVIFPAAVGETIRVVNVVYTTDTNNAVLSCTAGTTAYSIVETNVATTSVTNKINSTYGLTSSCVLVLQHGGVCYPAVVSSWNSTTNTGVYGGTNVVLASGGWGVRTTPGDSVYLMSSATETAAAASGAIHGEAIYTASLAGRPVRIVLTPALATNQINSATVAYGDASTTAEAVAEAADLADAAQYNAQLTMTNYAAKQTSGTLTNAAVVGGTVTSQTNLDANANTAVYFDANRVLGNSVTSAAELALVHNQSYKTNDQVLVAITLQKDGANVTNAYLTFTTNKINYLGH